MFAVKLFRQVIGSRLEGNFVIIRPKQLCRVVVGYCIFIFRWRQGIVGVDEEEDDQQRDEGEATEDVNEQEPFYGTHLLGPH